MKSKKLDTIRISEIFYSFQGESTFSGRPSIFIRLSACNLNCKTCDTKYAFVNKKTVEINKIIKICKKIKTPYVCITGGEPLLQLSAVKKIIKELVKINKIISIETNGSISTKAISKKVKKVIDIKTPSSGECKSFNKSNLEYLNHNDELKMLISNKNDLIFAEKTIRSIIKKRPQTTILLSPNLDVPGMSQRLVKWILKKQVPVVFQPQLHKLIKEKPIYLL
jgi:7-carboxy-7-deazaguanine synthase